MLEIHFPKETENTMFFWSAHYQRIYFNVEWSFDCLRLTIFFENTLKFEKMETKNTIGYISFVDFQYSYHSKNILKVGNIGN